jgi:hypothetical protein
MSHAGDGAGLSFQLSDWFGYLSLLALTALVVFAATLSFAPRLSPSDFTMNPNPASSQRPSCLERFIGGG